MNQFQNNKNANVSSSYISYNFQYTFTSKKNLRHHKKFFVFQFSTKRLILEGILKVLSH